MALNYGGQYFYLENGKWNFKHGAAEQAVVKNIHDMIHVDKSVDAAATGLSGSAVLPAFFGGKCAMTVQGNFQAQGMIQQGPRDFNWAMFPLLKGTSQNQVANPQTLSVSQQSKHKKEAMQFIEYFANASNLAKLAAGDWLIPANPVVGEADPEVDEADRELAGRDVVGRPLPEGQLGVAGRVRPLEGGGGDAAVRAVPEGLDLARRAREEPGRRLDARPARR